MRSIEGAVALVLAGSACGSPSSAPSSPVAAAPTAEVVVADAGPATIVSAEPAPSPTAKPAPKSPSAICAEYKSRTAPPDGKNAPSSKIMPNADNEGPSFGDAYGYADGKGAVLCTLTWQHVAATIDEMVTPRCCPPMRGPCPKPYVQQVAGEKMLVETVRVGEDGSAARQRLEWVSRNPHPTRMPYCGRRPEGFALGDDDPRSLGELLAGMAALEAASIDAFERLARELAHHGAPPDLVTRADVARDDEVRHTRAIAELARRQGAVPGATTKRPLPIRSLDEIARENAIEGCVHETWGALVATFQSARASTPELRRLFAGIAEDERSHAELAHDIHRWIARASIEEERRRAADELGARLAAVTAALDVRHRLLGMPDAHEARRLHAAFFGPSA